MFYTTRLCVAGPGETFLEVWMESKVLRHDDQPMHIRGQLLPGDAQVDLYISGDHISFESVPGARTLRSGGYIVPGLVDAHAHPGNSEIGEPIDDDQLRSHGRQLREHAVSAVRVPGSASRLPEWFAEDPAMPRVVSAGLPIAATGGFFAGWGRQLDAEQIPQAAVEEASRSDGWCKLIIDWFDSDGGYSQTIPGETIAETVRRVHEIGGRVAVHSQSEAGGLAAVHSRVDSIEHGMHLPMSALPAMAEHRIALVPTASTFIHMAAAMNSPEVPENLRSWYSAGLERHEALVRAAVAAGVAILAGTDLPPGHLNEEIRWLHQAGLSTHAALGAASWQAREFLGLGSIEHGGPADLLVFDSDPRDDLFYLESPDLVITRGLRN